MRLHNFLWTGLLYTELNKYKIEPQEATESTISCLFSVSECIDLRKVVSDWRSQERPEPHPHFHKITKAWLSSILLNGFFYLSCSPSVASGIFPRLKKGEKRRRKAPSQILHESATPIQKERRKERLRRWILFDLSLAAK